MTFTATGLTGSPTTITLYAGNNQTAAVNATVATAPSVRVTDMYGNPVTGVAVTFAVASGGGSITGPTTTTNASGIAVRGQLEAGHHGRGQHAHGDEPRPHRLAGHLRRHRLAGAATKYVVGSSNYSPPVSRR